MSFSYCLLYQIEYNNEKLTTISGRVGEYMKVMTLNKGEYKEKYDERQTLVRGKAFKYAFEVAIVYFAMLGIFAEADLTPCASI